ncbi:MAG: response regulator [Desulfobacteraceae bacterium]|nr:response regulator [Desulfobacteraceae bacterium]
MERKQEILIVDDKLENIFNIKQILADTNTKIIGASSGNEALIANLNHRFALTILNVKMPKMDGYELAKLLRSEEKTNKLPIIFISRVYSNDYHMFKGYDSGAIDFLVKPFDAKILLNKVIVFLELDHHKNEIKNQLDQLKISESKFESLVLTIPDIVYRIDPGGKFTFINNAIEKLGYTPAELIGSHFSSIILPVDVDRVSRIKVLEKNQNSLIQRTNSIKLFDERRTEKRKTTGLEIHLISKKKNDLLSGTLEDISNSNILVEVNSAGLYSNKVEKQNKIFIGTVGVIRDITDRKKLEDKLRNANDQLEMKIWERTSELVNKNQALSAEIKKRKTAEEKSKKAKKEWKEIFEAIGHMTMILDKDRTIISANRSTIEQIGKSKEEIIGKKCYEIFHHSDTAHENCPIKHFDNSGDITTKEVLFKATNKSYIVSCTPIFSNNRKLQKIIHIATDITHRKKLEKDLIQSHKMEAIGTLAGGIAHDFNNILSVLLGYSDLSLQNVEPGSILEENLKEIYNAGIRAKDLVKQILTFARQAEDELLPSRVDLIVKEVIKFIRSSIPSTIAIKDDIQTKSKTMANVTQIHQVLMNLCSNASHAMNKMGGILTIGLKDIKIDDKISQIPFEPGDYLELTVSDTGTGISPDIIDHIFEPYFTTKDTGEGTGMGLAVVQSIIKETGGYLTVKSRSGKGTVFTIFLPIIIEKDMEFKINSNLVNTKGDEHILLVDDEPDITKVNRQILQNFGYRVTTKNNSIEALELFAKDPDKFDIVISDMTMPEMPGDKLLTNILKIKPDIPVILCTGYSKNISKETAIKLGIKAFLNKPLNKKELVKTIRKLLD